MGYAQPLSCWQVSTTHSKAVLLVPLFLRKCARKLESRSNWCCLFCKSIIVVSVRSDYQGMFCYLLIIFFLEVCWVSVTNLLALCLLLASTY